MLSFGISLVAMSTTSFASWFGSRGRFGRPAGMRKYATSSPLGLTA